MSRRAHPPGVCVQNPDIDNRKMRIRCTKRAERGMTLVEVVMAVALLGVMASGIIGSFRYGFFVLQLVRENQ